MILVVPKTQGQVSAYDHDQMVASHSHSHSTGPTHEVPTPNYC